MRHYPSKKSTNATLCDAQILVDKQLMKSPQNLTPLFSVACAAFAHKSMQNIGLQVQRAETPARVCLTGSGERVELKLAPDIPTPSCHWPHRPAGRLASRPWAGIFVVETRSYLCNTAWSCRLDPGPMPRRIDCGEL